MNHADLQAIWDDLHTKNTWVPVITKALADLTPEQAAWKPTPDRHSIWQLVNHLVFWHRCFLQHARTGESIPRDEIARRNWVAPDEVSETAWRETLDSYGAMREEVSHALQDPDFPLDEMPSMMTHTTYHLGQIMQLRAMQELASIE